MTAQQWLTRWGVPGLILIALAIRESFSFWTGHPYDLEVWIRTGYRVAQSPSINPYNAPNYGWPAVPGASFAYNQGQILPPAAYPPFWSLLLGGIYRLWESAGGGNRFVLYWLLKQPPIAGDLLAGWLLYRLAVRWTGRRETGLGVLLFWTFFPYDIAISAIWGQFDSLIVVVLLAALLVRRKLDRSLAYGLGIFVKWATAVLLPFEFFRNRGVQRSLPLLSVVLALGLTAVAFWATGWGVGAILSSQGFFATTTSEGVGGGGGMSFTRFLTTPQISAPFDAVSPLILRGVAYLWAPAIFVTGWAVSRYWSLEQPRVQLAAVTLVLTVFLLLRFGLNEQYFLYLFPLLLLDAACFHPARRPFLTFLLALVSAYFVVNNAMGLWFLSPADPSLWSTSLALNAGTAPFPAWTGVVRVGVLYFLALLVSFTLVQLVYLLATDQKDWTPWLYRVVHRPAPTPVPPAEERVWGRSPTVEPEGSSPRNEGPGDPSRRVPEGTPPDGPVPD